MQQKKLILCTRELQRSIADSVHRVLSNQINMLNLSSFFTTQKSGIYGANGSEFIFMGIRSNTSEIKSLEGVDICWIEEAQTTSRDSWDIIIPTIRAENSELWISFNPNLESDPTYQRFVLNPPPDSVVVKTTYADNPFFPEVMRREMEWDRKTDYGKYLWVWEGETRKSSEAQVFHGKWVVDDFETPLDDTGRLTVAPLYGADWGFAQDPTILVRSYIQNRTLFIDYEAYGVGVDIDNTPELFDRVPDSRKYEIVADSARPETISYMNRHGFRITGAEKWRGSIEDGVQFLRGFEKIVIHPRCKHVIDDFTLYSHKTDRITGMVLPDIIDKHNHAPDAIRYSLERVIRNCGGKIINIQGW